MIDTLLQGSATIKSLLGFARATNQAITTLYEMVELTSKEIVAHRALLTRLYELCEMLVKRDPQLKELLEKAIDETKKGDVN